MKKVLLLNNQGGSYGVPLSNEAIDEIEKNFGIKLPLPDVYIEDVLRRDSPILIEIVEKLGSKAFGNEIHDTQWAIVDVPDDMNWAIAFADNGDEILYDKKTAIEPEFPRNYDFSNYYF